VVGVNGGGKTTTIGKLANKFASGGAKVRLLGAAGWPLSRAAATVYVKGACASWALSPLICAQAICSSLAPLCPGMLPYCAPLLLSQVVLAAGDTFRAAAAEQLEEWARRSGAEIVRAQVGTCLGAGWTSLSFLGGMLHVVRAMRVQEDAGWLNMRQQPLTLVHNPPALCAWPTPHTSPTRLQGEKARPDTVLYQAVDTAVKSGADLVLCDTSGRLHTNWSLMVRAWVGARGWGDEWGVAAVSSTGRGA